MSAEVMRAVVEFLAVNKLGINGKHVYLMQGGQLADWAHLEPRDPLFVDNKVGCVWWLSKHSDRSIQDNGKMAKGKRVADLGADFAALCTGPVVGAIFDAGMGLVGGPQVGGIIDTVISAGIEVAQGRGSLKNWADPDMAKVGRDQRSMARGKPEQWYNIAFDQDFAVGGFAAFVRYSQPPGVKVCLDIKKKNDFLRALELAEKKSLRGGGVEFAREMALEGHHNFFITQGNQIVRLPA